MSFTADSIAGTWKRLKMQYFVIACGGAIALSAAIAFASWQGTASPAALTAAKPVLAPFDAATRMPQLTIYLAGSQEQAKRIREGDVEAEKDRLLQNPSEPQSGIIVLILDSPEAEGRALNTMAATYAESAEFGSFSVQTVDLRGR